MHPYIAPSCRTVPLLVSDPSDSSNPSRSLTKEHVAALTELPVNDLALYQLALTHRSYMRGRSSIRPAPSATNERLEFLGDALLGFLAAEHLYEHYGEQNEGYLTRLRAKLVNGRALARYAERLELGRYIRMSENMAASQGRQNATILADAFEALIGAVYLDHGLAAARRFVRHTVLGEIDLEVLAARDENFKSLLLEYVQADGNAQPEYRIVHEEGPSHDKTFTAEVVLEGEPLGRGTAGSKKKAEQEAAAQALTRLQEEER